MHYSTLGGILSTLAFSSLASAQTICNNSPLLCNRAYNNITYLGAHNSPFVGNVTNNYHPGANQFYSSTIQLDAGVRHLSFQIHRLNGNDTDTSDSTLYLCHTNCVVFNGGKYVDWMKGLRMWMDDDRNRNEVVTLTVVNAVKATAADLDKLYREADLAKYGYVPSSQSTPITNWPTLQEMINTNKRLVTWVADLNGDNSAAPYLLNEFSSISENKYANYNVSDFACELDRPGSMATDAFKNSGRLFFMNHFMYDKLVIGDKDYDIPYKDMLNTTNSPDPNVEGSIAQHAAKCSAVYNKAPNYILVDYFNSASPIKAVDKLNGVDCCIFGRTYVDPGICGQNGYVCYHPVSGSTNSTGSTTGTTGGNSSSPSATTSTNAVAASQTASTGASARLTTQASATFAGLAAVFFAMMML